jgi:ribosomal protein S18 acetylase RimI-like enzyme
VSRADIKHGHVSDVQIEPLTASFVNEVVDIHIKAFPTFFLSFLGPRFLREFYASFLADPVGMGFVACEANKKVIGAVVGPLAPSGYFRRLLKRRWWAFCLAGTGAVFKRPSCVVRLLRAVFYRGEPPSGPARALLSSIAVSPTAQGRGVGKKLVERWVEEARKRGAQGCYLTTDAENNDAVNGFYRSLGWKVEATYPTPEGRKMNRYVLDF